MKKTSVFFCFLGTAFSWIGLESASCCFTASISTVKTALKGKVLSISSSGVGSIQLQTMCSSKLTFKTKDFCVGSGAYYTVKFFIASKVNSDLF